MIRLDKLLSNMGIGSRNEMRVRLKQGGVSVNGTVVKSGKEKVDPQVDQILYNGIPVVYQKFVTLMLNKPAGVISATQDAMHQTVLDLLDEPYVNRNLFPVGRLDIDTVGLLILTNDGALSHEVLSPKKHVPKRYQAQINTLVTPEDVVAFESGITLDDGYMCKPAILDKIEPQSDGTCFVQVVLYEGKFHQVKRMFESLEKHVIYLKRIQMGGLELDPFLLEGQYRVLEDFEIELLKQK